MDLKELLGEDLYSQVTEKLGDKKIIIDDGNLIPKLKFDQVDADKKKAEKERDTYKTKAEHYEGGMTKDEVEDLKANLEKNYKIKSAINAKFSKIEDEGIREFLESKIDEGKLKLSEDGVTVEGLDEQFNTISEKYSNILNETAPSNTGGFGNYGRNNNNKTNEDSKSSFIDAIRNNSLRK